ncbi:MAG: TIGR02449 family protein [Candidatus Competibacteraceae bacterium]|nr:TIGR02449 family protein [Candidatus Competibacteraceae bacterium]MBK7983685.1 TIGR02449 family protein [Candidatus Competibacteraceae bacterium]MBK8897773.1 TIGR02449 family protein [Candidatus Competibacteraceae bacterium]MBK8961579.1 TIGR02449 family protein [Candidatus Competibacteraceae bacterium]MBK9950804.1 TIGR02449 family protein [Candidatus Competibacteraceae bacterium]
MKIDELYETVVPSEVDPLDSVTETAASGLAILAERVEQLAQFCERLLRENQSLREQQHDLQAKCEQLHEKNELSRSRIEAMVVRLKSLEQTP